MNAPFPSAIGGFGSPTPTHLLADATSNAKRIRSAGANNGSEPQAKRFTHENADVEPGAAAAVAAELERCGNDAEALSTQEDAQIEDEGDADPEQAEQADEAEEAVHAEQGAVHIPAGSSRAEIAECAIHAKANLDEEAKLWLQRVSTY
jgi:hypothetical protein